MESGAQTKYSKTMKHTFRALFTVMLAVCGVLIASTVLAAWTTTIIHVNDTHSHIDASMVNGQPLGGYDRLAAVVKQTRQRDPSALFLHAGDTFQGTAYFSLFLAQPDARLYNHLGLTAMTVGNHEFDRGPSVLQSFMNTARFPVLAANLDVRREPRLRKLRPSTVVTVKGRRVGIIGATTPELPSISSPGPTVRMRDTLPAIQAEADRLTRDGVRYIILLSHLGYEEDVKAAKRLRHVDLIVGGHSHTVLGSPVAGIEPQGPYPTRCTTPDGAPVYVVQSWEWAKAVGTLNVTFNDAGQVVAASGRLIPLSSDIAPDPAAKSLLAPYRAKLASRQKQVLCQVKEPLTRSTVRTGANALAAHLADAAQMFAQRSTGAVVSFVNAGGVRADIDAGPLTWTEAVAVAPFENPLVAVQLTGAELQRVLSHGCAGARGALLHPSKGFTYVIDMNAPSDSRVTEMRLHDQPVRPEGLYTVVFSAYILGGGDGHTFLKARARNARPVGIDDTTSFTRYLEEMKTIDAGIPPRITVIPDSSGTGYVPNAN